MDDDVDILFLARRRYDWRPSRGSNTVFVEVLDFSVSCNGNELLALLYWWLLMKRGVQIAAFIEYFSVVVALCKRHIICHVPGECVTLSDM